MWRCCGQVVIVSFHSSFVSFGLKKRAKNEPRSGIANVAPGVRKRDGRSIYAGHLVSAFLGSQKRARIGVRKCCSLTKNTCQNSFNFAHTKTSNSKFLNLETHTHFGANVANAYPIWCRPCLFCLSRINRFSYSIAPRIPPGRVMFVCVHVSRHVLKRMRLKNSNAFVKFTAKTCPTVGLPDSKGRIYKSLREL